MIHVSTDISKFMKAEVTGSYFRESSEYLHSSINSKRQSCNNTWMHFFRNVYKIKWRLSDDEYLSLTRLFTSNILPFTQISINVIIGERTFKVRCIGMTVLHEGFRKKRITKDSERKRILFKGDALFIVPTVKGACITFLWFKNQCSSETDQYFIMRQVN